jgi:hypothetical protein
MRRLWLLRGLREVRGALGRGLAWLTPPRLWLVVVLGGIGAMQLASIPSAIDLAYHVKAGQLMVATHRVLRADVFAWQAQRRWLDQNWGAQVVMYGLWRLGGFPLLAAVNALVTVGAWGMVAAAARLRCPRLRLVAAAVLAGYAASAFIFAPRPQMFSVLLFALELYLLELARKRPWALAAVPALMPVWANTHGGFLVGLALLGIEAAVALARRDLWAAARFVLVGLGSGAALLLNPWGVGVFGYALGLSANPSITSGVSEWAPASIRQPAGAGVLLALGVLAAAAAVSTAPLRAAGQLARVVPLALLSLWTVRAGVWLALALPIAVAELAGTRQVGERRAGAVASEPASAVASEPASPGLTALVLATVALALALAAPWPRERLRLPGRAGAPLRSAPVALAEWLAAHPQPGRMYNFQPWGSYLEFRLGPRVEPAVDSRIELYRPSVWSGYAAIVGGRWDAERLLRRLGVGYVVTDARETPDLVAALAASGRWRVAYAHGSERVLVAAPAARAGRVSARTPARSASPPVPG